MLTCDYLDQHGIPLIASDQPGIPLIASDQPGIPLIASDQPIISSSVKRPLFGSSSSAFSSSKRSFILRSNSRTDAVRNSHSNQQSSNKHLSSDNEDDRELCSSYERLIPIQEHRTQSRTPIQEHRTLSRAPIQEHRTQSSTPIQEHRTLSRTPIQEHRTQSRTSLLNIHDVSSVWTTSNASLCSSDCDNGTSDRDSHSRPSFYTGSACSSNYSLEDRIRSTSPESFSIILDIDDNGSWTHGSPQTDSSLRADSELDEERPLTPCSQLSLSFSRVGMK